jgi:lysyl-tRNA synthetase class 2
MLQARAALLGRVRAFFADRGVMEVETPLLSRAAIPAPYLESFATVIGPRYLQTSPEFAMKRLLAAGSGPIYQVAKAFRQEESGHRHNPEFSLLEWYRPGWNSARLMDEVEALVGPELPNGAGDRFERLTYGDAFRHWVGVDAHRDSVQQLQERAVDACDDPGLVGQIGDCRDAWLDLLLDRLVVPALRGEGAVFLFDYPASQAALALIRSGDPPVAERFELFVDGIELANGFHELTDADEQRRRFIDENAQRVATGLPEMPLDHAFLAALEAGMPDCSGVALGLDRLLMLAGGHDHLDAVLAFPWDRA